MLSKFGDSIIPLILGPLGMSASPSPPPKERKDIPWWMWASVAFAWLLLLRWWHRRIIDQQTSQEKIEIPLPPDVELYTDELTILPPAEPVQPDDLKHIEGIGPKIECVFQAAGIQTFAQLAASDVAHLRDILQAADIRIADPATWPEQATLAAQEEWEALETLQGQLKGGRRA